MIVLTKLNQAENPINQPIELDLSINRASCNGVVGCQCGVCGMGQNQWSKLMAFGQNQWSNVMVKIHGWQVGQKIWYDYHWSNRVVWLGGSYRQKQTKYMKER